MALWVLSASCGASLPGHYPALELGHRRFIGQSGRRFTWLVGSAGVAGLARRIFAVARHPSRSCGGRASARRIRLQGTANSGAGVNFWRALPADEPPNLEKMLRDKNNDIVRDELDITPFRWVTLLLLPVNAMPCVGQVCQLVLPADGQQQAAITNSLDLQGGFIGCAVNVPKAQVLPRGCIGAEVQGVARPCDDQILVSLRGVNCLRIIDRSTSSADSGFHAPLVQEVLEWTHFEERSGGEEGVAAELQRLIELFKACGDLQRRTDIWAAGDLYSKTLDELTDTAVAALGDVQLGGVEASGPLRVDRLRRAVLAAHAAVGVLRDGKRASFLCDPCSVLRRLRRLTQFLTMMRDVLGSRARR